MTTPGRTSSGFRASRPGGGDIRQDQHDVLMGSGRAASHQSFSSTAASTRIGQPADGAPLASPDRPRRPDLRGSHRSQPVWPSSTNTLCAPHANTLAKLFSTRHQRWHLAALTNLRRTAFKTSPEPEATHLPNRRRQAVQRPYIALVARQATNQSSPSSTISQSGWSRIHR